MRPEGDRHSLPRAPPPARTTLRYDVTPWPGGDELNRTAWPAEAVPRIAEWVDAPLTAEPEQTRPLRSYKGAQAESSYPLRALPRTISG